MLVVNVVTAVTGRPTVADTAADTVMRGTLGAPTEAAGTATLAPTDPSVRVEHGLVGSGRVPGPQHVTVVPLDAAAAASRFAVTAVTPTAFRIAVPQAHGTQPARLAWRVDLTRR